MRIGVDFDNTIVCYDSIFHRVAVERGLVPAELEVSKNAVRDHLRSANRESAWTEMQGEVYGARMAEVEAFADAIACLTEWHRAGVEIFVISHKTRRPYVGEQYDLHRAAYDWLEQQHFFLPDGVGLTRKNVFFELTKSDKLARIAATGCTHFIDDLPEFLAEPTFPAQVERWLFDPHNVCPDDTRYRRVCSWQHLQDALSPTRRLTATPSACARTSFESHTHAGGVGVKQLKVSLEAWHAALPNLLKQAGLPDSNTWQLLAGGGNNRVLRVESGDRTVLLKVYFRHLSDLRDRLGAEFAFARFAWDQGLRQGPQPLACDVEQGLGLYEFIEGRKLNSSQVNANVVKQAIAFFQALNARRNVPAAHALPDGSEACFSLTAHLHCVERRLQRLTAARIETAVDQDAQTFVTEQVIPVWRQLRDVVLADVARLGLDSDRELEPSERCLSPSDFGFHNALVDASGTVRFIDFEYAGWDDVAKVVGDFFHQPAVPVPLEFFDEFVSRVTSDMREPDETRQRIRLLLPVYQMKWVIILLNEFLPAGDLRRNFAQQVLDREQRKLEQLAKARERLAALLVAEVVRLR